MSKRALFIGLAMCVVLLSGVIPGQYQSVWFGQYLGLFFAIMLGIALFAWRFNKFLTLLLMYSVFSVLFIAHISARSVILLTNLALGILACMYISNLSNKCRRQVLIGLLVLIIVQSVWTWVQFFNLDPIFNSRMDIGRDSIVGFSGSKDQLGAFFSILAPLSVYFSNALIILPLIGLYFSKSSFALVAAFLSVLLFLWLTVNRKKVILIILLMVSTVAFFFFADRLTNADFRIRGKVWYYTTKFTCDGKIDVGTSFEGQKFIASANPLFGYGLGNYLVIFPKIPQFDEVNCATEKFTHAHNDFLELFLELGYVGIAIIIMVICGFIYSFIKSKKTPELSSYFACIVAYLLNSVGHFLYQQAVPMMLLIVMYGLYRSALRDGETSLAG